MEPGIPNANGASFILKWSADGVVPGLNDYVTENGDVLHPPVAPVFWAFRVMVGIGMLMLALSWVSVWKMRKTEDPHRLGKPLLFALVAMTFSGWVATLAGWYTTEIGQQSTGIGKIF